MATFRERPYANRNFLVDLGTGEEEALQAGFTEIILPEAIVEDIEYRNGNEKTSEARKLPGRTYYGNVTLKRGVIGSLDLYQWWDQARDGDISLYRRVVIRLLNEDRSETVMTWILINAWPVRYSFSTLNAQGDDVLVETIELAFEGLEIE